MKLFILKLTPYCITLAIIMCFGAAYDPLEGDLIRLSYRHSLAAYSTHPSPWQYQPISKLDTTLPSVAIFGDSFLGTLNHQPFWTYLTNFNVLPFRSHDFDTSNPIDLCINMADSVRSVLEEDPDFVVIEMVERSFYDNTDNLKFKYREIQRASQQKPFHKRKLSDYGSDGVTYIARRLGFCIPPCNQSVTLIKTRKAPMLLPTELLVYSDDLNKRRSISEIEINDRYRKVKDLSQAEYQNSDIIILIIPDKLTAYEDFISESLDIDESFLNTLHQPPHFVAPSLNWISDAIASGQMEVYRYSDTHFGDNGSNAIAQNLDRLLQTRLLHALQQP